jgi:hypothetical protein
VVAERPIALLPASLIEMIARKIIEVGASTVRDRAEIAKMAVKEVGIP